MEFKVYKKFHSLSLNIVQWSRAKWSFQIHAVTDYILCYYEYIVFDLTLCYNVLQKLIIKIV